MESRVKEGVDEVKCCGTCIHFKYETIDGDGWCAKGDCKTMCDFGVGCMMHNDKVKVVRHYIATLLQYKRWRSNGMYPELYRQPRDGDFLEAIDHDIGLMKEEVLLL